FLLPRGFFENLSVGKLRLCIVPVKTKTLYIVPFLAQHDLPCKLLSLPRFARFSPELLGWFRGVFHTGQLLAPGFWLLAKPSALAARNGCFTNRLETAVQRLYALVITTSTQKNGAKCVDGCGKVENSNWQFAASN